METNYATTKPGKYGTLHLFFVTYCDAIDPGFPPTTIKVWRYSLEHVYDAFYEGNDGDSWKITNVRRAK